MKHEWPDGVQRLSQTGKQSRFNEKLGSFFCSFFKLFAAVITFLLHVVALCLDSFLRSLIAAEVFQLIS